MTRREIIFRVDTQIEEKIAWHQEAIERLRRIRDRAWRDYEAGFDISTDIGEEEA